MNLVGYTATALSRNDIEDTPTNKNVVDFAIVELKDLQGNLVVMYDDAEGANPETQKTCDTNGQVTFFAEIGDYDLEINGKAQRINLAANIADYIKLETGESVQEFADSFALKIFQSPTDGGLTEIQTRTVNANEVYEVRKASDDSLVTIYSDAAGTAEIVQNGTNNISGSDGVVEFYIVDGDYYVEVDSVKGGLVVSKLKSFLTVADMTNASYLSKYAEGTRIEWQGYYEQSDGGGNWGVLRFGTHTEDGGSIFSIDDNTYVEANLKGRELNVIKFGVIGDGSDYTAKIKLAIKYACSLAVSEPLSTWLTGVPTIRFPAGVYTISEPQCLNPTVSALKGYSIEGSAFASTFFNLTYNDTGVNNRYYLQNGGTDYLGNPCEWWGYSEVKNISLTTDAAYKSRFFCSFTRAGSPQKNRFTSIFHKNLNEFVSIDYGTSNFNSDLYKFRDIQCDLIPDGGTFFYLKDARLSQPVCHEFYSCDALVAGTFIKSLGPTSIKVVGGSIAVQSSTGRYIDVDNVTSTLGLGNNVFSVSNVRFEQYPNIAPVEGLIYYIKGRCNLSFTDCNFGQLSTLGGAVGVIEKWGKSNFIGCNIGNTRWKMVAPWDSSYIYSYRPSMVFDKCEVNDLSNNIEVEMTGAATTNLASKPFYRIINSIDSRTSGNMANPPADVDVNLISSGDMSPIVKMARFINSPSIDLFGIPRKTTSGAADFSVAFTMPVNSTIKRVYVVETANGLSTRGDITLTFYDGSNSVIDTVTWTPGANGIKGGTVDLMHNLPSDALRNINIEVSGGYYGNLGGYIIFEYI